MGKVISVVNQKGGVGKTTTTVNLAACVGANGYKVLLVDIDPQGNATSGMGVNKRALKKSTYDLLVNGTNASEALIHTEFKGVDLLPANINLAGAEIEIVMMDKRENRLKMALSSLVDDYDFIFLDCPPSLGIITLNALNASDTLLVPIQCEYYALEGLAQLMNTVRQVKRLYNPQLEFEGVLVTMFDGRLNLTNQVVREIKKVFPKKLYFTTIPRNVRLSEAPSHGMPVIYYDASSKGADAYNDFSIEFLKKNGLKPKK